MASPSRAVTRPKYAYRFAEGDASMRDLLGGKGANLCEMARLGLPVPPGFVISTEACRRYYALDRQLPDGLWDDVRCLVAEVEEAAGRRFGDANDPLLLSVRSGSRFSMPGMMDTILNLGLSDETVEGLARATGDRRFALDSYRRFIQLFAKVAMRLDPEPFEAALADARSRAGAASDAELDEAALAGLVPRFKEIVSEGGASFPGDPWEQLLLAVRAVFDSWNNPRAIAYREHHRLPHDLGTAASVMAMVFGNSGWDSGTGVCFSRSPATGEPALYGEYLPNAQGEDVVSGARTPKPIAELAQEMPEPYRRLADIAHSLERHYRDVQDIEFTIERGRLYILQTRAAKRTAAAAVKTAVDMAGEGLITAQEAVRRVPAADLAQLLLPRFDEGAKREALRQGRLLGRGLNASPGAATGRAVFDADAAAAGADRGETVILVRPETSADDMPGILRAAAVLTSRGGITSHAAVVTRGLGKPAVVGCTALQVDPRARRMSVNGAAVQEGDEISVDGFSGEVFAGRIQTVAPDMGASDELAQLLAWADTLRRLGVFANADTAEEARQALAFGAQGIGLCRTEHMFFQPERLPYVREMLMRARDVSVLEREVEDAREALDEAYGHTRAAAEERLRAAEARLAASGEARAYRAALDRLAEYQAADFRDILRVMDGRPVVIRLLDAPLHEFLPPYESLLQEVAVLRAGGGDPEALAEKERLLDAARSLHETNPMLGHRGLRLGLTYPDIYEMQVRAILRATHDLRSEGLEPRPEVMAPLVVAAGELVALRRRLDRVAEEEGEPLGRPGPIPFGTMIELPRAALAGGRLAPHADFFSFGSNDLTQMTFGFSRDDAEEKFLRFYLERGFLVHNPFATIDELGVGRLIRIAADEGRAANPQLELGLCGEHGGDPESIAFCHRAGLDYVSCSPLRLPIARLAAAQAA
ncbi:MAG TPA: pyruvate, phosphate dikinase, partial [Dehalococcoidia bacterium]|nr:pyruvate, phosphate dikinase [Dehalococcoidia bacterium]